MQQGYSSFLSAFHSKREKLRAFLPEKNTLTKVLASPIMEVQFVLKSNWIQVDLFRPSLR